MLEVQWVPYKNRNSIVEKVISGFSIIYLYALVS